MNRNIIFAGIGASVLVGAFVYQSRKKGRLALFSKASDTNETKIQELHPLVRNDVRKIISEAKKDLGIDLKVVNGLRSFAEQKEMFLKGASKTLNSYHNYGLAVDIVEVSPYYGYNKSYPLSRWRDIAEVCKKHGFDWGHDMWGWDENHFQKSYKLTTDELYEKLSSGKVDKNGYVKILAL